MTYNIPSQYCATGMQLGDVTQSGYREGDLIAPGFCPIV